LFGYRQDVTLLGLVTPDFQRTHARLGIGNVAQLEAPATVPVLDQLRQGIGEPTGTDVMNKADGVGFTQRPATVDHLLGTPLDLGVTALYRSEVEISAGDSRRHRRRRPAAQANQHGRATQHNQLATHWNFAL